MQEQPSHCGPSDRDCNMGPMDSADEPGPAGSPVGPQAWEDAARRCAARLLDERGVSDEWSVTEEDGVLWVNYDRFRVSVGIGTDTRTEAELFEELDLWVADDRPAGPGRWLPRDEAALQEAIEASRRIAPWLQAAAGRLAADLENAWGVTTVWQVVESRVDLPFPWPGIDAAAPVPPTWWPAGRTGFEVTVAADSGDEFGAPTDPVPAAVRPEAPEIEILMRSSDGSGSGHTASLWEVEDEEDAVYELVDLFEDDLVEEVWGKWPACPTHDRLLGLDRVDGAATWVCPHGNRPLARVGFLTKSSHAHR